MINKIVRPINVFLMSFLVILFVMTIIGCKSNIAKAATNEIRIDDDNLSDSLYADLNDDGVKECIEIKASMDEAYYIKDFQITIDEDVIFRNDNTEICYFIKCINLKNNKQVLWIKSGFESGITDIDGIYMYSADTNMLEHMIQFDSVKPSKGAYGVYVESVKATNKGIEIKCNSQFAAVGYGINYKVKYNLKGNKFVCAKDTVSVLKGKKYTAQKNIEFLKSPTGKKVEFKINSGQSVVLKKVRLYKKSYYLMFKNGSRTGWIKASKKDIFEGVQLVG